MRLRINIPLKNYKKGQIIKVDDNDRYWLRRLKDAKIDNCVEIVVDEKENLNIKKDNKKKEEKKK